MSPEFLLEKKQIRIGRINDVIVFKMHPLHNNSSILFFHFALIFFRIYISGFRNGFKFGIKNI